MRLLKYNVFCILLIIPAVLAHGQKTNKIALLEGYFTCNACKLITPAVSKNKIEQELSNEFSIETAAEKIKHYFTAEGDGFILFCKTCDPPPKTFRYVVRNNTLPSAVRGFGTYVSVRHGANEKGGEEFYRLSDMLGYLSDSLLVFDSLKISTASMANKNPSVFASVRASFTFNGTTIERDIPYDAEKQEYTLSYKTFFGNRLTRSLTDSIPVTLSYIAADNNKVTTPRLMKLFFAADSEKQDMRDMFTFYKKSFPDWSTDEIADELLLQITAKYKKASKPNFIQWLKQQ